jgi:hypothetical protein
LTHKVAGGMLMAFLADGPSADPHAEIAFATMGVFRLSSARWISRSAVRSITRTAIPKPPGGISADAE